MPVYNGERFLREAIDSVLRQTLLHFELIIINDGSTDNSKSIIDSYKDPRVISIHKKNEGMAVALNLGASKCSSDLIARMDADDICEPNRLEMQYNYFVAYPYTSVLSGAFSYINEDGVYLGRSFPFTKSHIIKEKLLNSGCVVCHPAVMMRKEDFLEVGGYSVSMGNRFTDYHLWVKFIKKGFKISNMHQILLKYRITENAVSSEYKLSDSASELLLQLVKEDSPSDENILALNEACITSPETFTTRNSLYDNIQNKLYNVFWFLSENTRGFLFSSCKNLIGLIRK